MRDGEQSPMKLSAAQQRLVARMKAGATLKWAGDKGKYQLVDGTVVRTVDPRTVDLLLQAGTIERDLLGACVLAPNA